MAVKRDCFPRRLGFNVSKDVVSENVTSVVDQVKDAMKGAFSVRLNSLRSAFVESFDGIDVTWGNGSEHKLIDISNSLESLQWLERLPKVCAFLYSSKITKKVAEEILSALNGMINDENGLTAFIAAGKEVRDAEFDDSVSQVLNLIVSSRQLIDSICKHLGYTDVSFDAIQQQLLIELGGTSVETLTVDSDIIQKLLAKHDDASYETTYLWDLNFRRNF